LQLILGQVLAPGGLLTSRHLIHPVDIFGIRSLCRRAPSQLLQDVARIVDDLEPPFMRAVLDRLFLSAGIGKDQVVVSPVVREAMDVFRALLGPVRQDGNL